MRSVDSTARHCSQRIGRSKARPRGFTLIEVLAALVIVALGMLGVIEAVSQTASNSTYLRDKTIAHWIAMNQLTLTRLAPRAPKIDKSSDEVEMAGRRWRWSMEVTQTPVETVLRIDIRVRPEDADEESSLASVTGFYGTAMAQPGTTVVLWQGDDAEQSPPGTDDDGGKKDEDKEPPPAQQPPGEPDPDGEPVDPPDIQNPIIPDPEPQE
jgi:general secretion pathway protein I